MNNLDLLINAILAEFPLHESFLSQSLAGLNNAEKGDVEKYISHCQKCGISVAQLAESYVRVLKDTITEQLYFKKHKKYRCSTFAEVADRVYFDEEYMKTYMYGLAISAFLWPNHCEIYRFFDKVLPTEKKGSYLEIGPGHGFFMNEAIRRTQCDWFTAVDISPTSLAMTRELLSDADYALPQDNWDLVEADFLTVDLPSKNYEIIIMGEVLEHVEKPKVFLDKLFELASHDSFVFITTCINSPAIDHICLFRSRKELEEVVRGSGFSIEESFYAPYTGKTLDECEKECLAVNVAMSLCK